MTGPGGDRGDDPGPTEPRPPRWTRALLARVLPARTRQAVLADLEALWRSRLETGPQDGGPTGDAGTGDGPTGGEAARGAAADAKAAGSAAADSETAPGGGRRAADRWYRRQAWAALAPAARARLAGAWSAAGASLRQDGRFALNQLRRHPGVGLLVVVTLALGTGATTAIFSVVHGTLLRPLPYDRPDELVMVTAATGGDDEIHFLSPPDALGLEDEVGVVDQVAVFGETTVGPLTRTDRPEHVKASWVSWNAFRMFGVEAARGRTFVAADGAEPAADGTTPSAVVIGHGLWERAFGADPDVVGRSVDVWGARATVVGVLPEGFRFHLPPELNVGADVDVWVAYQGVLRDWDRDADWFRTVARLRPGTGRGAAQRAVDAYAADLRERWPRHARERTTLRLTPLSDAVTAGVRGPVLVLFGAVTLVLLIACGNAANLLLARGAARAGEMAVRASLGAGAGRLGRQLLTESAVLAALGAGGGALLAAAGVRLLHALRPPDLARLEAVALDLPVLAFAVGLAVAATLLAGVLPALQAMRMGGTASALRRRDGSGLVRRARSALVVGQVALSVMLLGGTTLLVRTFAELQAVPLGFEPDRVLTVTATQTLRPAAERRAFEDDLVRVARAVPGVSEAGIVFPLPMNGVYERSAEYVPDDAIDDPAAWRRVYFRTVSPSYFDAMGLDVLRGRGFTGADESPGAPVVVVDERLARRAFGGADPLGRYLRVRGLGPDTLRARIVGVAEWAPQWDHRDTRPTLYLPRTFYRSHEVSLVARVEGNPAGVAPVLAAAVRGVDPRFPSDLTPMTRFVGDRLARARFIMVLMQAFAAVALGLTAVGLYGVLSYTVRQRTRELGVRRALGAPGGTLTGRVVGGGVRLATVGVGVGVAGTLAVGRGLESQLYGVEPADPVALGATAALVLAVAVLASLAPALRAARVDPAVALRGE